MNDDCQRRKRMNTFEETDFGALAMRKAVDVPTYILRNNIPGSLFFFLDGPFSCRQMTLWYGSGLQRVVLTAWFLMCPKLTAPKYTYRTHPVIAPKIFSYFLKYLTYLIETRPHMMAVVETMHTDSKNLACWTRSKRDGGSGGRPDPERCFAGTSSQPRSSLSSPPPSCDVVSLRF